MPYQNKKNVAKQHVQALLSQLGWNDATTPQTDGFMAVQTDDGDVYVYADIYGMYRSLLQEVALRRVAP